MLNFETDHVIVLSSQEEVFTFLSDLNNYKSLMPDSASHWESTADHCKFKLSGMANIGLAFESKTPVSRLDLVSYGEVMFPFKLTIHLNKVSETETEAKLVFAGDVNPFMRMMVEKPIQNFFNYLVHKVQKHFGKV
ncbi:MAG: hypothetical protein MH137_09730 [Flavobacteriales bacterium]|nr:hypothetical protein [Flavobacteriales bacterium]